jgi:hypothetical protein
MTKHFGSPHFGKSLPASTLIFPVGGEKIQQEFRQSEESDHLPEWRILTGTEQTRVTLAIIVEMVGRFSSRWHRHH